MIVKRALEEPIRQIVENAGLEGSVIVEKVKAEKVATRGFDAESLEFVDMIQAGIIDPTKVERVALQNAASVASLLLTTEALITDLPEDKPAAAPPMPHGDCLGPREHRRIRRARPLPVTAGAVLISFTS